MKVKTTQHRNYPPVKNTETPIQSGKNTKQSQLHFTNTVKHREQELWNICETILTELYQNAKPSADFNELKDGKLREKEQGYNDHYLPMEKQEQIIATELEKHNLSNRDEQRIKTEIHLGVAPTTSKDRWTKNPDSL